MKKVMCVLLIVFLAGCCNAPKYPPEFRLIIQKNVERMRGYMSYLEAKDTTREQDADMLQANYEAWQKLEGVVNK